MHPSKNLRFYANHRGKQFLLYFGLEERKMELRTSERAESEGNKDNSKVSASKIEP